ncbi:MAG: hypothetical protein BWZ10_01360 [candidate division BRC1 bacterium ADurb.BinA364]|nr:MAG: hypothetical protein BWZ10_01360 [candidate division BRC1 bacterium ADurb.BinA364]
MARRIGRIVVDVKDIHRRAVERGQAGEVRAALVDVIDIEQQPGGRMPGFDGDIGRFAQARQRRRGAPELQHRGHAQSFADFQQNAIALGEFVQSGARRFVEAGRRGGDAGSADRGDHRRFLLELLEGFGADFFVAGGPARKADRAFDGQAGVLEARFQFGQGAALVAILRQIAGPGLDSIIAGLRGDFDLALDRQRILASNRGGVEAIAERRFGGRLRGGRGGWALGLRGGAGDCRGGRGIGLRENRRNDRAAAGAERQPGDHLTSS